MRPAVAAIVPVLCLLTGCPHPKPTPVPVPPANYYCGSTKPLPGQPYPILQGGPVVNGQFQYSGQVLTHTPIGNETFCQIRQIYFEIPPTLQAPTIQTVLVHHNGKIVEWPLAYDTVDAELNGNLELYRVDAQAADVMLGDYDFVITVTGKPIVSKK